MASAAVRAGLAVACGCDGLAVACKLTSFSSLATASYLASPSLSRRGMITLECPARRRGIGPFTPAASRVDPEEAPAIFRRLRDGGLGPPRERPCGGIGRRARLKIEFRKECWFDSGQGHQLGCSSPFQSVRNRPHTARNLLK